MLLLGATLLALVWANSPLASTYEDLWSIELTVTAGDEGISEDLRHWVNDGLMVFFFYVIGLEIRREFAMGELRSRREAAIPMIAALAGMVVPAAIFLAFNAGGEAARGWGIVMATDIAFVLGALAILGPRCPQQVRVFLLTLAIVDDVGAITVIAVFYSASIDLVALAAAGAVLAAIAVVRRLKAVWRGPAYFLAGLALWIAMHESGVHPTIAGVVLGLLTAVFAPQRAAVEHATALTRSFRQSPTPQLARSAMRGVGAAVSPNERLQDALHPWTSYVIVPLFALANAGVVLDGDALERALGSSLTLGVVAGLVVGKGAGITLASLLAVRLGAGDLPRGVGRTQLGGAAALAGIGFTVSLFVTDLAFTDPALQAEAKVGILAASVIAALLGWTLFRLAARRGDVGEPAGPARLDPPVDLAHDHVRCSSTPARSRSTSSASPRRSRSARTPRTSTSTSPGPSAAACRARRRSSSARRRIAGPTTRTRSRGRCGPPTAPSPCRPAPPPEPADGGTDRRTADRRVGTPRRARRPAGGRHGRGGAHCSHAVHPDPAAPALRRRALTPPPVAERTWGARRGRAGTRVGRRRR